MSTDHEKRASVPSGSVNGDSKRPQPESIDLGGHENGGALARQISIQLSPAQYEQLFLQPGGRAPSRGDYAKRFGNPTPLGLAGFLMCLTPVTADLMQWRGATSASTFVGLGAYIGLGGVCMFLAGIKEWILGNTFPSVVFSTFGGFWISFAALNDPELNILGAFGADATVAAASKPYTNGIAWYYVYWGILVFVYLIASLRTNLVFAILFFTLDIGFFLLAAAYFDIGYGNAARSVTLLKTAGGFTFVTCLCGWWLLMATLFAVVEIPFALPVGDMSGLFSRNKTPKANQDQARVRDEV